MNFQKDDGYATDYSIIYKYLSKGIGVNNQYVGIPYYTDGCGNNIKLRASFAVFAIGSNGNDLHDQNPAFTSWDQYAEILKDGFTIANHNYGDVDSKFGDRQFQIKENEKYIYQKMKERGLQYICKTLIVPDVQEGFAISSVNLGLRAVCSTFGGDSSDGQWPVIRTGGQIRMDNLDPLSTILSTRYWLGDDWKNPEVYDAGVRAVNELFNHTDGNQTNMPGDYMKLMFSHGPGEEPEQVQPFINFIQYVINHPKNNDSLWVPSLDEFSDYFYTKLGVTKNQTVQGNKIIVTLDTTTVEGKTRFLDMSILAGSGLQSVAVSGVNKYSHNLSTGLINIYRERTVFQDPGLNAVPPIVTAAVIYTSAPNILRLSYNRPVTQSIYTAYKVPGTIVKSISGNGTEWTLTLANNMLENPSLILKYDYRAQLGDAKDAVNSSFKVCSSISRYITFKD